MYLYLIGVFEISILRSSQLHVSEIGVSNISILQLSRYNTWYLKYTIPRDPPTPLCHYMQLSPFLKRGKMLQQIIVNVRFTTSDYCAVFPVLEMVKNAYIRQLPSWEGTTTGVAVKPSTADSSSTQSTIAMQFHHSDPHLRKEEEFGVPGRTMKVGKEKFAVCTVIGAAPHTSCPFYRQHQVMISWTIYKYSSNNNQS